MFKRLFSIAALSLCGLAGCTWLVGCSWTEQLPTRKPVAGGAPVAGSELAPTSAPPAAQPKVTATPMAKPAPPVVSVLLPKVQIEALQGVTVDSARKMFVPAPVAACKTSQPGFVRIVVTSDSERTAMMVDPNSTANAAASECVMKALSIVDVDDIVASSAADGHSKVQSILNISW